MRITTTVSTPVAPSFHVEQVAGMFGLTLSDTIAP